VIGNDRLTAAIYARRDDTKIERMSGHVEGRGAT